MNPNRLALIAVLLLPSIAALDAGAQTRQQRVDQAARIKSDPAADAAAAATEAQAAADAAAAAADAVAADPYELGYESLPRALSIFRSRGSRADERWIQVMQGTDGRWSSADLKTATVAGPLRTVWLSYQRKNGGTQKSQERYDCLKGTIQSLRMVLYDREGSFEHSSDLPERAAPTTPGSVGEAWLEWACAK